MTFAGPTYLVTSGELPWKPEDIRQHLRLLDPSFDGLISAAIASQCLNHGTSFHGRVWSVARGDDLSAFLAQANKIGKLVKIGPAYQRQGITYHDCEYGIDPVKARKAFRSIINWCHDDEGIYAAMRREDRGEFRPVWPDRRPQPVPSPYAVAAE